MGSTMTTTSQLTTCVALVQVEAMSVSTMRVLHAIPATMTAPGTKAAKNGADSMTIMISAHLACVVPAREQSLLHRTSPPMKPGVINSMKNSKSQIAGEIPANGMKTTLDCVESTTPMCSMPMNSAALAMVV